MKKACSFDCKYRESEDSHAYRCAGGADNGVMCSIDQEVRPKGLLCPFNWHDGEVVLYRGMFQKQEAADGKQDSG